MPKRQMPKRTALMLVSLLFVVIYTASIAVTLTVTADGGFLFLHSADPNSSKGTVGTPDTSEISSHPRYDTSKTDSSNDFLDFEASSDEETPKDDSSNENSVGGTSSYSSSKTEGTVSSGGSGSGSVSAGSGSGNGSGGGSTGTVTPPPSIPTVKPATNNFTSAIWISVFDMANAGLKSMNSTQFQSMIDKMFDNSVSIGIDTVFCQVRPYGDAFYKSSYFPYSKFLTGTQGKDPGYDPLKIMVASAHKRGLKIHAWINPYRISTDSASISSLADSNQAKKWLTGPDTSKHRYVLTHGNGLYYNPAVTEVQRLIINGIREICQNYDVDGIHIDDYFYPDNVTPDFDRIEYEASGTSLGLADWRRANVNALVSGIYSAVKSYGLTFSISPTGNTDRNYSELYADVKKWISTPGYTDCIIPQIYFGYEYPNAKYAYAKLFDDWMKLSRLSSVDILIGLGNYKIDTVDSGSREWCEKNDIIARQTSDAYSKKADGVVLFSYGSVFGSSSNQRTQTAKFKETINALKD